MTVESVGSMPISALVADNTVRVAAGATLLEVARELAAQDVGIVVVETDDRTVSGVVSERDVVHALGTGREPATIRAADVASTELVWCDASATISEVAEEMMERWIRHVLVERNGRLVGVVSARDLLGAYAAADESADD
jgi:CBS domain-containing protein